MTGSLEIIIKKINISLQQPVLLICHLEVSARVMNDFEHQMFLLHFFANSTHLANMSAMTPVFPVLVFHAESSVRLAHPG